MLMLESQLADVKIQIQSTRVLLDNSFAVRRGTGKLLAELDSLIARKRWLEAAIARANAAAAALAQPADELERMFA